ncbi:MAG: signal peptidase I [Bryobacteraceae bacterium]|nr:signal peptidase I [Bryobacteraceae bacterium]
MWSQLRQIWTDGRQKRPRGPLADWSLTFLVLAFGTTSLLHAFVVPSGSMESTILVGDHVLVDRLVYAEPSPYALLPYRPVERGDIIVFLYPEDPRKNYVKRVIGVPGDRLHLDHGKVIRNGKRLVEPYAQYIARWPDTFRDSFPQGAESAALTPRGRDMVARHIVDGELVVPAGSYFAMGDNRDNSEDSRYWGLVPRENIIGKPALVYWSFDAGQSYPTDWDAKHLLDVAVNFFTKTRWERTFSVPRAQRAQEVQP